MEGFAGDGGDDPGQVVTGPKGEVANRRLVEHSAWFEPRLERVTDRIACAVGYGLANSTVVVGPEGAVVIDTGESVEEAREHQGAFAGFTGEPVRAVLYTHFHYTNGTRAYFPDGPGPGQEIWGHAGVDANLRRVSVEIGPAYVWGVLTQFGGLLPADGPDAMPNHGIGPWFFDPRGGARTAGYLAPTRTVDAEAEVRLAGVRFHLVPAASDSDDTLIVWLPDHGVVVNNHVWPALFNVFALRGESYRDPLAHVAAVDRIRAMDPEHLVGVHGPPVSGRAEVRRVLTDYRDALQFLWDQTVRGLNRGLDPRDVAAGLQLPPHLADAPWTRQLYGLVRHHVRQIHTGLFGWWTRDEADLLALPPSEEARRAVAAMGGRASVLAAAERALAGDDDDVAWAARLGSWLLRGDPGDAAARRVSADAFRKQARATTSANVRSALLTRARELEGLVDRTWLDRRPAERAVLAAPPDTYVRALRVRIDPVATASIDRVLRWHFTDSGTWAGLHVRRGVAEVLQGPAGPGDAVLHLDLPTWAALAGGRTPLRDALEAGSVRLVGDVADVEALLACFDHADVRRRP